MIKFFIKEKRKNKGLSQSELAKKSGVSQSHIRVYRIAEKENQRYPFFVNWRTR